MKRLEKEILLEQPDSASTPEGNESYPALQFEELFGLHGIGAQWLMPDRKTMKAVESELWQQNILTLNIDRKTLLTNELAATYPVIATRFRKAKGYARVFNALNPQLETIQFDKNSWRHLRGFLHGVVSGFNTDDIAAWIDKTLNNHEETNALKERIIQQYNTAASKSWYPLTLRKEFDRLAQEGIYHNRITLAGIQWEPCPKTIQNIHSQLDKKHAPLANQSP